MLISSSDLINWLEQRADILKDVADNYRPGQSEDETAALLSMSRRLEALAMIGHIQWMEEQLTGRLVTHLDPKGNS